MNRDSPATGIRPEVEMLFCCARTRLDAQTAARIRCTVGQDLDWPRVLDEARFHGMMPLLHWQLDRTCPGAVPSAVLDQLRESFDRNAQRNFFLTNELLVVLRSLEQQGINAVPLKGPVLAASAYGDIALRQFADLDILVHEHDVLKAKAVLISRGYQPRLRLTLEQEVRRLSENHDYGFARDNALIKVDIQWGITSSNMRVPLKLSDVWENLERVSLHGQTVFNLSPEDLLLILSVHGSKHLWARLPWICDIAQVICAHERVDWGRLLEQARVRGAQRMLSLGLLLATDILGAEVPEPVAKRVNADRVARSLAHRVREHLLSDKRAASGILEEEPVFYFRMRERWRDKLQLYRHYHSGYVRRAITPNARDREFVRFRSTLSVLYYAVRPIRLVRQYGLRTLIRRLLLLGC